MIELIRATRSDSATSEDIIGWVGHYVYDTTFRTSVRANAWKADERIIKRINDEIHEEAQFGEFYEFS